MVLVAPDNLFDWICRLGRFFVINFSKVRFPWFTTPGHRKKDLLRSWGKAGFRLEWGILKNSSKVFWIFFARGQKRKRKNLPCHLKTKAFFILKRKRDRLTRVVISYLLIRKISHSHEGKQEVSFFFYPTRIICARLWLIILIISHTDIQSQKALFLPP